MQKQVGHYMQIAWRQQFGRIEPVVVWPAMAMVSLGKQSKGKQNKNPLRLHNKLRDK